MDTESAHDPAKSRTRRKKANLSWAVGVFLLSLAAGLSLFLGRYPAPGFLNPFLLLDDPIAIVVFTSLRLPRTIAALFLGMTLGCAGNSFQMVFGNPLVEPGFLGVSQGAAFGAALAMITGLSETAGVQVFAFFFAFAFLGLAIFLSGRFHFGGQILRLVLSGIIVSAFGAAALSSLKYFADPIRQLPEIIFWTMGGLSGITWKGIIPALLLSSAALLVLFLFRWRIMILSLDEVTASTLGVKPGRDRIIILTASVAAVAAMTSVSGITAWTGLLVPHMARRIVGHDGRHSMPASMLLGAAFVLFCDTAARLALPGEIPLGIVTSLAGASGFAALLVSRSFQVIR